LERRPVICNFGLSTGKWYAEFKPTSDSGSAHLEYGIVTQPSPSAIGRYMDQNPINSGSVSYINDGSIQVDGSTTTGLLTYTANDIIGIAVDKTNSLIYFYKNGTLVNSGGTSFLELFKEMVIFTIVMQIDRVEPHIIQMQTSATHHSQSHQVIVMLMVLEILNTKYQQDIMHYAQLT
jgi:hypothetical protein